MKGYSRMRRINLDDKYRVIIVRGEEGQPQQILVQATFKKYFYLQGLAIKKNIIGSTRILRWLGRENEENVARISYYCGCPSPHHCILVYLYIVAFHSIKQ